MIFFRPKIRFELHGFTYLIEVIDLILRDAEARDNGLTDQEVDLCSEILKILFNLTVTVDRNNLDEVKYEPRHDKTNIMGL
jgi:hypothetical protein